LLELPLKEEEEERYLMNAVRFKHRLLERGCLDEQSRIVDRVCINLTTKRTREREREVVRGLVSVSGNEDE